MDDRLIDDNLFVVTAQPEWYAGKNKLSKEWIEDDRKKIKVNSRHFAVVWHRLFRQRVDGLLRRCVSKVEMPSILVVCYDIVCGGYFSGQLTSQRILKAWYFWPIVFKDAHDYMRRCDACQRYARNDQRMEMPLNVLLSLVHFEKWKIDYVGEVHFHSSNGMAYIRVATKHLTKGAEAKAIKMNTTA